MVKYNVVMNKQNAYFGPFCIWKFVVLKGWGPSSEYEVLYPCYVLTHGVLVRQRSC